MEKAESIHKESNTEQMYKLIVFNDSNNAFDHVIHCFIRILNHTPIQAHQCAQIIHNTGKYAVKVGEFHQLETYCIRLIDEGLDATITI